MPKKCRAILGQQMKRVKMKDFAPLFKTRLKCQMDAGCGPKGLGLIHQGKHSAQGERRLADFISVGRVG